MSTGDHRTNVSESDARSATTIDATSVARALVLFLPQTILGPISFYLLIYWWFVPDYMRIDAPISHPHLVLRILALFLFLPILLRSRIAAEALAASLPCSLTTQWHNIIAPTSFVISIISGCLALSLFAPVVGLPPLSPVMAIGIFGVLVLFGWSRLITDATGIFAEARLGNRDVANVAGLSGQELLRNDPRPHILYLRSFIEERGKATTLGRFSYIRGNRIGFYLLARRPNDEEGFSGFLRKSLAREYKRKILGSSRSMHDEQMIFAEYFADLGPYIAAGRPGECYESMDLGAAKLYIDHALWKDRIIQLIETAAAIIVEAAETGSLIWELHQVIERVPPEKVLLILPRNDAEYRAFRVLAEQVFPQPMPKSIPITRLLMFERAWFPVPLEDYTMILEDALHPFVSRLWHVENENDNAQVQERNAIE